MALPVTNHTITVTIDGTNRTSYLRANSLFIRSSIGNNGDVAEFTVIDDGTWQILDWQTVTIAINGTTVFGGYIVSSNGVAEGDAAHKTTFWSVECRDWSAIFDTVLVDVTYISETTDILDEANCIDYLFDTYLPGEGFDYTSQINSHYNGVIKITFDKISLRDALNKLADYTKAQWHVSPTKVLYYYNETDPSAAAFNIDTVAPNNSTTFDVLAKSLRATTDSIEIVNKVVVVGGTGQSRTRYADAFTQDTLVIVYGPLTKEPSAFYSVTYTTSDNVVHTVFADQIGIYPQETTDDLGNIITPAEQYYPVIANVDTHYIEFDISPSTLKNGATITVEYYYKEPISIVREDTASQSLYGRVFTRAIFDDSLVNLEMAARHGDKILEDYANGRITVQFDITRFGLLPGRLLTINTPAFAINPLLGGLLYRSDRGGYFLLENASDRIALEQYDEPRNFIVQEVAIQTVAVRQNEFMIVASVTAGFWRRSIIDTMRDLSNASAASPVSRAPASLSQISPALGEVLTGRAVFTDGGTANFEWSNFGQHTGVVMGLDSSAGSAARGAFYILDGGTVRTKIGYLNGFGSAGTVPTSGWGIWTNNGYFTGVVAASRLIGGTITGNQITGGTITGGLLTAGTVSASRVSGGTVTSSLVTAGTITSNQITGGTITAAQLSGGTITGGLMTAGTVNASTINNGFFNGGSVSLANGTITMSTDGVRLNNLGTVTNGYTSPKTIAWGMTGAADHQIRMGAQLVNSGGTREYSLITDTNISQGTATSNYYIRHLWSAQQNIGTPDYGAYQAHSGAFTFSPGSVATDFSKNSFRGLSYDFVVLENMVLTRNLSPIVSGTYSVGDGTYAYESIWLQSPNGTKYKVTVSNAGALVVT